MSLKNLNASSKIHKHLFGKLKDKRIYKIYNKLPKTFKSYLKSRIKKMLEIITWIDN